jgi:CubicO group peptidase (beta-lactamase class C family)
MTRRVFLITLILSLLASAAPRLASEMQTAETFPDAKQVDAQVASLMNRFLIPGVGLALIKDGKVVYTKGYGASNVEKKQEVTETSTFAIGSITKTFTALAIMQLVEAGKVDLDAPVTQYLPDFKLAEPSYTPLLKVRHLLSQSSGLPRADEQWALSVPTSRAQVIEKMAEIKPTAKPGELWQYCNQNFAALSAIIEKTSGTSYEAYIQKHIFDPLGMKSANFTIEALFGSENPALPYSLDVLNGFRAVKPESTSFQAVKMLPGAGAINANVHDMAVFALMYLGKGPQLVSAKSLAQMQTPQIRMKGSPEGDQVSAVLLAQDLGYGFGTITGSYRDRTLVGHDGSIDGYESSLTLVPADGAGVVILTNTNGAAAAFTESLRLNLIELLLGLSHTPTLADQMAARVQLDMNAYNALVAQAKAYHADSAALAKLAGDYTGVPGSFKIIAQADRLTYKEGDTTFDLIPFADGKFVLNGSLGTVFEFRTDANGVTIWQGINQVAQRTDNKRVADTYVDPAGHFSLPLPAGLTVEQKDTVAVIKPKDGSYTLTISTQALAGEQDAVVSALAAKQTPSITSKPVDVRKIPVNGQTWTQYIYQNADQTVFVVEALAQGKVLYLITIAGSEAAIGQATPVLNTMLLGFQLNSDR